MILDDMKINCHASCFKVSGAGLVRQKKEAPRFIIDENVPSLLCICAPVTGHLLSVSYQYACVCVWQCEVCSNTLGHMKAGDSMWIYKRMVHCENCFDVTRGTK